MASPILRWPSQFPGVVTQPFGTSPLAQEPAGWLESRSGRPYRANRIAFPGGVAGLHIHRGLDIRAYEGTKLYAGADGVCIAASTYANGELFCQIRIAGGLVLSYHHLSAHIAYPGTQVKAGDVVGLAGSTGNSLAAHLHFEVRRDDLGTGAIETYMRLNPADYFAELGAVPDDPDYDVNLKTDIPVALCDVAPGTDVIDAATGKVVIPGWAGGSGIGLYSIGGGNAGLRLDLGSGGSDLRLCYVNPAKVSNVRLKDAPPPVSGDYDKGKQDGKKDQHATDVAALQGVAP